MDGASDRRTVAGIQKEIVKKRGRKLLSWLFRSKSDQDLIASWRLELNRILQVFNVRSVHFPWLSLRFFFVHVLFQTELAVGTHAMVSDMRKDISKIREEIGGQIRLVGADYVHSIDKRMLTDF